MLANFRPLAVWIDNFFNGNQAKYLELNGQPLVDGCHPNIWPFDAGGRIPVLNQISRRSNEWTRFVPDRVIPKKQEFEKLFESCKDVFYASCDKPHPRLQHETLNTESSEDQNAVARNNRYVFIHDFGSCGTISRPTPCCTVPHIAKKIQSDW